MAMNLADFLCISVSSEVFDTAEMYFIGMGIYYLQARVPWRFFFF